MALSSHSQNRARTSRRWNCLPTILLVETAWNAFRKQRERSQDQPLLVGFTNQLVVRFMCCGCAVLRKKKSSLSTVITLRFMVTKKTVSRKKIIGNFRQILKMLFASKHSQNPIASFRQHRPVSYHRTATVRCRCTP